jgi:hypothetical protein
MPDSAPTSILPGVITAIVGLAGTLATLAFSWIKERDEATKRVKRIEEASKRLAFWDQWWKIQQTIGEVDELSRSKELVRTQIILVTADLTTIPQPAPGTEVSRQSVAFSRMILFLYKPRNAVAYLPRVFFWVVASLFIYGIGWFVEIWLFKVRLSGIAVNDRAIIISNVTAFLKFSGVFGGLLTLLWFATRAVERVFVSPVRMSGHWIKAD